VSSRAVLPSRPLVALIAKQSGALWASTEAGSEPGFDGGKQVNGRKRHLTVDTEGNLLVVHVHAANIQDRDGAEQGIS